MQMYEDWNGLLAVVAAAAADNELIQEKIKF